MTQNLDRSGSGGATPNDAAVPTSASRRVRARLARRITAQRNAAIRPVLEPLVAIHRELYPKANLAILQRAYDVAEERHADQKRKSGDPYITHPLAVATILAELGMDTTTLIAALLHDTVEDTGYSLEQLTDEFGEEVAHLVDGVTKLDKVVLGHAAEAETIRKMIIAMARDPRVLVIRSRTACTTCARCGSCRRRSRRARPARRWK
jgi:guanosine-3',5'-bis(diphosphate) 3'-pyrophosphohydrolase